MQQPADIHSLTHSLTLGVRLGLPERAMLPLSSYSNEGSIARAHKSMKKTPSPGSRPLTPAVPQHQLSCWYHNEREYLVTAGLLCGGRKVTEEVPPMLIATLHLASGGSVWLLSIIESYLHITHTSPPIRRTNNTYEQVHGVPLPPAATSAGRKSPTVVIPVRCAITPRSPNSQCGCPETV